MVPLQAEARVEMTAAPTVVDGVLLARALRVRFENLAVPLVLAHLVDQTAEDDAILLLNSLAHRKHRALL